jgi:hypothetical protein
MGQRAAAVALWAKSPGKCIKKMKVLEASPEQPENGDQGCQKEADIQTPPGNLLGALNSADPKTSGVTEPDVR